MEKQIYQKKWHELKNNKILLNLSGSDQLEVERLAKNFKMTHQEFKIFIEALVDLKMWGEGSLFKLWSYWSNVSIFEGRELKKELFNNLSHHISDLKSHKINYSTKKPELSSSYKVSKIKKDNTDLKQKIFGMCPVESKTTVCCNLRTIDAVKNCGFGCSYCSIQTMYTDTHVVFEKSFKDKLNDIELDPNKHYHIGTGQSSDALLWGDTNKNITHLCQFARKWPKIILEFKTKSKNVKFFTKAEIPKNIFCSWSLNPNSVIQNEEHLTASLEERLAAAREIADLGILVGFHLHPMVYYNHWERDYQEMIDLVKKTFKPEEVAMISFGTLTYPKPIIKKIRTYNIPSKILQMPMVSNPEGKLTYPEDIKNKLFQLAYNSFDDWKDKVFFYLCMEEAKYWLSTFNYVYSSNDEFEKKLIQSVWKKMSR